MINQPVLQFLLPAPILRLFGVTTPNAMGGFATAWGAPVAALLIVVAAVWFTVCYYRDGTRPSWWVKTPMLALRMLALCSLMLILAQPVIRFTRDDSVKPNVIIMVDTSASMAVSDKRLPAKWAEIEGAAAGVSPSAVPGMTRLAVANNALNHSGIIKMLSGKYNVHLYSFASKPHAVPLPADSAKRQKYQAALVSDSEGSDSTQIGTAMQAPMDELAGQPIAGAIVLSDGGNNLGEDPLLQAASSRSAGVRVSTSGIGDPTSTKDVALLSVLADDVVRVNNTVSVYAAISQRGYAGKPVTVTLLRNGQELQRQTVRMAPDDQKQEIHFTYVPAQAGRFFYNVVVAGQPGEITLANNKRTYVQSVISKKLKVLYVENEPRYEYRYLKNAILRDTSLDFGCILLSGDDVGSGGEGNIAVTGFPATEKELFDYDIVILGDVPRTYFTEPQLQALRRFVEDRGASLLVIAGEQHMPHEYAGTPLEACLPAVISSSPDPIITEEPFRWQLTAEGKRSPITQLEDSPSENDRVWATLPGMYWAAGVSRVKPGATVLAQHPTRRNADGPYPLVVTQPFGAGKCFLELVDSTWQWRWRVGDRYFYRYWGQVLRTLTPRELPGNSRFVQLNADRSNYRIGEKVSLNARLLDAYYHPIKAESAMATIKTDAGQEQHITLQSTPGSPGLYTAQIQPDRVGRYEVSLTSPANPQAKADTAFVVESLALEKQRPELDLPLLKKIASAGGGKYYEPDKLTEWANSLPNNKLLIRNEQEIELWSNWRLLALFLAPLFIEWMVRKRTGLL